MCQLTGLRGWDSQACSGCMHVPPCRNTLGTLGLCLVGLPLRGHPRCHLCPHTGTRCNVWKLNFKQDEAQVQSHFSHFSLMVPADWSSQSPVHASYLACLPNQLSTSSCEREIPDVGRLRCGRVSRCTWNACLVFSALKCSTNIIRPADKYLILRVPWMGP